MSQLRITALVRGILSFTFLFGALLLNAQTSILPRFQVNFAAAEEKAQNVSFRAEDMQNGTFDFVVLQHDEEIFRFRSLDVQTETLYSFILVNDKFKALEGLNKQATLTTYSNFGSEIVAAYAEKNIAFVGILECMTKNGATSRLQVAKMVSEDDEDAEATLSDANNK